MNGFSFVKNSNKYYDDCAKILGNMILRELTPTLHIPWSVPFQLDDPMVIYFLILMSIENILSRNQHRLMKCSSSYGMSL